VLQDHKNRIVRAKGENNIETVIEVLLSLRVNALQISPELRRNLITELIRNDIFFVKQNGNFKFLSELLQIEQAGLKHAVCAMMSVVASTVHGVEYLLVSEARPDFEAVTRVVDILYKSAECTDGSVTQRFCLAILQKMSCKEEVVELLNKLGLQTWLIDLLEKSTKIKGSKQPTVSQPIHVFCLDFASALLANILHSYAVLEALEKNQSLLKDIMTRLLNLLKEAIPTSVLIHVLICLSYLSKERFNQVLEECLFVERISDFVEWYSIKNPIFDATNPEGSHGKNATANAIVDKKTVLDLCAHMFHPKESSHDVSGTMEYNELKQEEKIKEFENVQGDLIFECFQDEVS